MIDIPDLVYIKIREQIFELTLLPRGTLTDERPYRAKDSKNVQKSLLSARDTFISFRLKLSLINPIQSSSTECE